MLDEVAQTVSVTGGRSNPVKCARMNTGVGKVSM